MTQSSETYLGGVISPFLGRGRWLSAGYGICTTSKRVIGFRSRRTGAIFFAGPTMAMTGVLLHILEGFIVQVTPSSLTVLFGVEALLVIIGGTIVIVLFVLFPGVSVTSSPEFLRRLDTKKDFEATKDEIHQIFLGRGALTIELKTGPAMRIGIGHKAAFKRVHEMMRLFYPEALKMN